MAHPARVMARLAKATERNNVMLEALCKKMGIGLHELFPDEDHPKPKATKKTAKKTASKKSG